MDRALIRAWWSQRQGLDGSLEGKTPAEVLERSGWARSVGGVGPYLTLFSRGSITRETADAAAANLDIHELPAARGCTYVVPRSQFALALKVGESFAATPLKTAAKLGVTQKEIDKLCDAVLKGLAKATMDPDEIREATGSASRSLGPEGVKKGITTTLPLALGLLQARGDIRRVPVNARLDQQRYKYAPWRPNPLANFKLTAEQATTELGRLFFGWIGPATVAEFQWFSGLGVKAAKAAVAPLKLTPADKDDDRLTLPDDYEAFKSFKIPKEPRYVLVSSLDAISAHRRNVTGLLDSKDANRQVIAERSAQAISAFSDLPSHAILDRGRLVGLWEYDPATESIAWSSFVRPDKALEAAVRRTEQYVREQLGDARSFSLDSPKSRAPRIEALRNASATSARYS